MTYVILEYATALELEKHVNNMMKKGFRPQGGIAVSTDELSTTYCQAMVHERDDIINDKFDLR